MEESAILRLLQRLSKTERKVFELRCQGLTYKEIADSLNRQQKTIEAQLSSVYRKLELGASRDSKRWEQLLTVFYPAYLQHKDKLGKATPSEEKAPASPQTVTLVRFDEVALVTFKQQQGLIPVKEEEDDEDEWDEEEWERYEQEQLDNIVNRTMEQLLFERLHPKKKHWISWLPDKIEEIPVPILLGVGVIVMVAFLIWESSVK